MMLPLEDVELLMADLAFFALFVRFPSALRLDLSVSRVRMDARASDLFAIQHVRYFRARTEEVDTFSTWCL